MKIYPTVQFRMASSGNKASIIKKEPKFVKDRFISFFLLSFPLSLLTVIMDKRRYSSFHFQNRDLRMLYSNMDKLPFKKKKYIYRKSLFLTAYNKCEINLNNEVLSSILVFFFFFFKVTLYNHKKKSFSKGRILTYWYDCCYYSFLSLLFISLSHL